ncbi:response regulator [Solirubrobacter phytolaccae]|uniref:histidine kinase n=1 Tax=Solirubrobacter phytolaccae TaxID=1404360 RepID=A0A9X3NBX3_9ACTN|nr:ATP-binding protein [Solirubrobacter phytolaccae]MDA0182055.1 response regulator [Solirubrobacter phytolaccae]
MDTAPDAHDALARANAASRLAGGVAHDFNNALTSISAYAHLALSRLEPQDPVHADVREIVRAAEHAGRLVSQLMAFSQGEQAQVEVVDVNRSVRDVGRLLTVVLGEQVELDLRLANALPGVHVNLGALEQAVMQLALNARDAMSGGGRLVIESAVTDGRVLLVFADDGPGMDAETALHAVEPFFSTKGAVGLGLTTVNALCERLGGELELESAPGIGTTVRLHLPAVEPPPSPVAGRRPHAAGTVLMVEDEETVRTVVERLLSAEGYRVLVASSGEEALELAAAEPGPIDLLVSDVVLGGITGPELAAKLKTRRPALKTLLMSGYAGTPVGPVDDFLPKPFSPFELARRVRRILRP